MTIDMEVKPLAEVTTEALDVLFQKLGAVNATRFLNQFTVGYGNYLEEREALFGHLTLDDLINDIKKHRDQSEANR
ncbi:MAG: hypothetical protein H6668_19905 [Ardenticatenaceae bacterium]|nr:hypothetical protein [Ardenticatenaceae bacterium]